MSTKRVLIGCTGSVASIKIPELVEKIVTLSEKVEVCVVVTEHAQHFFKPDDLPVKVHRDEDEWKAWSQRGDPVLHIDLRRWADIFVIAPLDANTLAKMANGICDNLLTCIVRAWDMKKPLLFAPAMNTYMWEHPLTGAHISSLQTLGYTMIPCIEKLLMCNDKGFGAMAEVDTIVQMIADSIKENPEQKPVQTDTTS